MIKERLIYIKFDLHTHTKYSDGLLMPNELIDLAVEKGLDGIAITDHDTISAIPEALKYVEEKYFDEFKLIPGIEFGCVYNNEEIHILGYFIDLEDRRLLGLIDQLKNARFYRSKKIIEKINDIGLELTLKEVIDQTNDGLIGRPHIARAMVKRGYVKSVPEAFDRYIDKGQSCFVERFKLDVKKTIDLIGDIGGISVLAHPGLLKNKDNIGLCIGWGIGGIECIHSEHNLEEVKLFSQIARENDLKITGGSDCHGKFIGGELLLGNFYIEIDDMAEFKK